jgi:hypothetical protein
MENDLVAAEDSHDRASKTISFAASVAHALSRRHEAGVLSWVVRKS